MIVLCVGVTSCSKDDDKDVTIVGNWTLSKVIQGRASTTEGRKEVYPDTENYSTATFNSDGSYSDTHAEDGKASTTIGTYTYDSDKKIIILVNKDDNGELEKDTAAVKELTSNSLVFTHTLVIENEYYESHFTRK